MRTKEVECEQSTKRKDTNSDENNRSGRMRLRHGTHRDRLSGALGLARSSVASRRVHGAGYATFVGSWRSRFRVTEGMTKITRFKDPTAGTVRSFCARCGTPLLYERTGSPHMVNVPRALFTARTGRQPRYHIAIEESPEWTYLGETLVPLKGFPGVVWDRSRRKKQSLFASVF